VTAAVTDSDVVTARPVRSTRYAYAAAAFVLVSFIVTAFLMKKDNAGAAFNDKDQFGTVVIGIILAGLLLMPTRPRMRADQSSIQLRSFLGGWRTVPWELIVRVDFPSKLRFARIVLPGEEALAIYAVQRLDKELAVETMAKLRVLWAQTHEAASPPN
jgi:hypothetical protein